MIIAGRDPQSSIQALLAIAKDVKPIATRLPAGAIDLPSLACEALASIDCHRREFERAEKLARRSGNEEAISSVALAAAKYGAEQHASSIASIRVMSPSSQVTFFNWVKQRAPKLALQLFEQLVPRARQEIVGHLMKST